VTTFSFDLIHESWIPCIGNDGTVRELGLRTVFDQASGLREIADASPLVTAALHRLLIAILHRTHGPNSMADWGEIWQSGGFSMDALDTYFTRHRQRFDLFDAQRPFYQTIEVEESYANPVALLAHELLLGRPPTLFQQAPWDLAFSPAQAARSIVALQAFAIGGLIAYRSAHGEPASPFKYSQDAPLKKGAVVLTRGATLFETLMLNLHRYDGRSRGPWEFDIDRDLPSWERDEAVTATDRRPDGYVDLLTWQSRRVRLVPEFDEQKVVVRSAVMMRGHGFPNDWREDMTETMVAFRVRRSAKADDPSPWVPLTLDPDRSLWRNSLALYQSIPNATQRPRMTDWIADLQTQGYLPEEVAFAVDVFGMGTDRAKIDIWRHERLPMPTDLLVNENLTPLLMQALDAAEAAARQLQPGFDERPADAVRKKTTLPRAMQLFASAMLAPAEGRNPDRGDITRLVDSLDLDERYWARLEVPFRNFLISLPTQPTVAFATWLTTVEMVARSAFDEVMRNFDTSARALKAAALANGRFRTALPAALEPQRRFLELLQPLAS
jgi:CRISPR system Cascade subunit CasA